MNRQDAFSAGQRFFAYVFASSNGKNPLLNGKLERTLLGLQGFTYALRRNRGNLRRSLEGYDPLAADPRRVLGILGRIPGSGRTWDGLRYLSFAMYGDRNIIPDLYHPLNDKARSVAVKVLAHRAYLKEAPYAQDRVHIGNDLKSMHEQLLAKSTDTIDDVLLKSRSMVLPRNDPVLTLHRMVVASHPLFRYQSTRLLLADGLVLSSVARYNQRQGARMLRTLLEKYPFSQR